MKTEHPEQERAYLDQLRVKAGMSPRGSVMEFLRELWGDGSREFLFLTQLNTDFIQLMCNRLIMGGLRYGHHYKAGKPSYNRIASIRKRVKLYEETGNLEHLVDVANECLCEYTQPSHDKAHFQAGDDSGYHTERK